MAEVSPFVNHTVAKLAGVRAEVRTEAKGVVSRAKAIHGPHNKPGGSKITLTRGAVDYFANLEDEDGHAGAIEWGGTKKDGTPVPGLHVMRRATGLTS